MNVSVKKCLTITTVYLCISSIKSSALEIQVNNAEREDHILFVNVHNDSRIDTIKSFTCWPLKQKEKIQRIENAIFPGQEQVVTLSATGNENIVLVEYEEAGNLNSRVTFAPDYSEKDGVSVVYASVLSCAGILIAAILTQIIGVWRENNRMKFEWRSHIYGSSMKDYAEFVSFVDDIPTITKLRDSYKALCRKTYIPKDLRNQIGNRLKKIPSKEFSEEQLKSLCTAIHEDIDTFMELNIYRE